jgi:hypothetical protein
VKTDYAKLSDRELDRAIAEALGYEIYHYDKDYPAKCYYMLMDGDGDFSHKERKTEADAWEDIPHWATEYATAFELADEAQHDHPNVDITIQRHGTWGQYQCRIGNYHHEIESWGETPARALCIAWLNWQRRHDE